MGVRDIIVIGGSAGCFPALQFIIASLPANLSASVFVVVHTHSRSPSHLAHMIASAGALPSSYAVDGEEIKQGHIYVAPVDRHLIVAKGHVHVTHSPKEGLHRPSINVTFRSSAVEYRERVIGVLLSGMLDDGASGMWEIARYGGVAIVQNPEEAQFDSMPRSALMDSPIHYALCADEIASLLPRIVAGCEVPQMTIAEQQENRFARFSGFTCPECRGPLYEHEHRNGPVEFRCRVGHAFPLRTLLDEAASTQERKLYEAIVALEEGADMADSAASKTNNGEGFRSEAKQLRAQADAIRRMIENRIVTKFD